MYISPLIFNEELADGTYLYGWKSQPPLTPFAPSYAHYLSEKKIFSEEECKEWNTYLLEQEPLLLDKYRNGQSAAGGTGLSPFSITSRFPYFNTLKFDFHLVERLKTEIFNSICCLLDISGNTTWHETLYATSWFNVLRQGEKMETHSHGYHQNIFYGFHLNINAIETFTSYYHPYAFSALEDVYHVPNKIGYLTLFPNFIPHSVSPNGYETPRISIAGDLHTHSTLQLPEQGNSIEIGTYNGNNELQETK